MTLEAQLADELHRRLYPIGALAGPDQVLAVEGLMETVACRAARALAVDDDKLLAQAVIDVMNALWPVGDPPAEWWRTPVGRVCARSLGTDDAESVTHSVAAAMLGVHRGTVAQMVARGTLDRHPDGGVLRASVLQRLGRSA